MKAVLVVAICGGVALGGLFATGALGVPDAGLEDNAWGEVDDERIEVVTAVWIDNPKPALEVADDLGAHHTVDPSEEDVAMSYQGDLVGRYTELQELVALVDRGDVELHAERHELTEINTVEERLEHGEVEGRAVVLPP
ncbi:Alcohol dehydrogenase [Natrarchaeobaculum sulfurireducens]|uniref:Alcohol dehydrogenase n=1 Tax=Natrarchaeobaculum sulfurireducens TaxID=2044521 RepID=A0A346PKM6_9EURY|nr:Alcohol dehydrogenase [Natrarchaeobaculum sulfurireducens]